MRRIIEIDNKLLADAHRILGIMGVRDTINFGLQAVIRHHSLAELRRSLVKMDLDLTPNELEKLRDEA